MKESLLYLNNRREFRSGLKASTWHNSLRFLETHSKTTVQLANSFPSPFKDCDIGGNS